MLPPDLHANLRALDVSVPLCRRVLVVDDEPGNLDVLTALLEDRWEVSAAESGEQALEHLATHGSVDLIIADQRMPGMTGIELLRAVARRHPATMRIVLTGYTDVEPMLAAAKQGLVYRFLLKPFDALEMTAVVADALAVKATTAALLGLVTELDRRRLELQEVTRQLVEARHQLLAEERLNTLGRLVASIAQDVQAQSASLSLMLGLVRQTVQEPRVLAEAEQVWVGLGALRELLGQVRDYTGATTSTPVFRSTTPRSLLGQTMELFLMEELGHRCPVTAQLDPELGTLMVDATRLQQALLALLRNAVRASEHGQPITMALRRRADGTVELEVSDAGKGMEPAVLIQAREPFYSSFPTPGIGLGLEIARLGATAHGGELVLESQPGRGTTARLLLPPGTEEARDAG
jgi:signal transduction histidine kinase